MKKGFKWNKRGLSTVIATIIIVAIAIVMAIAVAYWAMGVGASFTRFEKLQITNSYAPTDAQALVSVKNTGTATASLDPTTCVFLNGVLVPQADVAITGGVAGVNGVTSVVPGASATITITIPTVNQVSGVSTELTIQSSAGNQYPTVVTLP
jgi:archaeal type IV pilus assembly protein PilA